VSVAGGPAAGAARLELVAGVSLLRPDEQVFDAMLAGWASQQLARNLGFATIENRQRVVRAFAAHAGCFPWQWSAQLVDEWCTDLRAVRHLARSTVRNYTEAVRLLLSRAAEGGRVEGRWRRWGRGWRLGLVGWWCPATGWACRGKGTALPSPLAW